LLADDVSVSISHGCYVIDVKRSEKNIIVENERKRVQFLMLNTLIKTLTTLC